MAFLACFGVSITTSSRAALFLTAWLIYIADRLANAALCSLNCISIATWERELDHAQRKNSIATRWSRIRFCLRPGTMVLAVFAIGSGTRTSAPLYTCIGVSAALLGVLDWLGEQIQRDERTALADLVLLTPLFLLALGIA